MVSGGKPSRRRATSGAQSPAQLTTRRKLTRAGSSPPRDSSTPPSWTRPERTGVPRTTIAPARSASSRSADVGGVRPAELHAVRRRAAADVLQRGKLLLAGGHHQLARPLVGHAAPGAVRVERLPACLLYTSPSPRD